MSAKLAQQARPARGRSQVDPRVERHRIERPLLLTAMAFVVVLVWLPALSFSFMIDELLTAWVTSDGLGDVVERAQTHQGNSPLYFGLLWAWRAVAGSSELALRLPSFVAALAAAQQLKRLGDELDVAHVGTGLIAAFVLMVDTNVLIRATTARPYGLLLLLLVVSARALFRFLDTGSGRAGCVWVLSAVATLAMTPFAAVALIAHVGALIDANRAINGGRGLQWRELRPFVVVATFAALPLVPQIIALAGRGSDLVISAQPDAGALVHALVPPIVVVAVLVGASVAGFSAPLDLSDRGVRFLLLWGGGPAVGLYAVSKISGNSLWVDRYRVSSVPAVALLCAMALVRLRAPIGRLVGVVCLVLLGLFALADFSGLQEQGWREAIQWAQHETRDETPVIALDSALVELSDLELLDDPEWQAYLGSPVQHYQLDGPVQLLPLGTGAAVAAYEDAAIEALVATGRPIVIVSRIFASDPPDHIGIFRDRLGELGYVETLGPVVGPISASVFRP